VPTSTLRGRTRCESWARNGRRAWRRSRPNATDPRLRGFDRECASFSPKRAGAQGAARCVIADSEHDPSKNGAGARQAGRRPGNPSRRLDGVRGAKPRTAALLFSCGDAKTVKRLTPVLRAYPPMWSTPAASEQRRWRRPEHLNPVGMPVADHEGSRRATHGVDVRGPAPALLMSSCARRPSRKMGNADEGLAEDDMAIVPEMAAEAGHRAAAARAEPGGLPRTQAAALQVGPVRPLGASRASFVRCRAQALA